MLSLVIPCIENDLPMLRLCIEGARLNVEDGIDRIFVVAARTPPAEEACRRLGIELVDEVEMMGFAKDSLELQRPCKKGWMYQQFIKLSAGRLDVSEDFLVMDADHVLLRPHRFVLDDGYRFYTSSEYHLPYFDAICRLFDGKVQKGMSESFISDKMVFSRSLLREMLSEIEAFNGCHWIRAVLRSCQATYNPFSEFETYGSWLLARHGSLVHAEQDNRYTAPRSLRPRDCTYQELLRQYADYSSVTELKR